MKKKYTLTAVLLFFSITWLNAQTLDVDFTGISGSCGSYIGLSETQTLGQSFTANLSGNLTSVNVGIAADACTETTTMNCVATVYDGSCTGTVLTTENFSIPTGSSLSMYPINFSNPANISSGQTYTLELSVVAGQDCALDPFSGMMETVFGRWILENASNCGGEYAGGTAYEPGCSSYPGDFYIQTYVSQCGDVMDVDFTGISGSCGSYIGLSETQTLGQSFTANLSGNLTSVNVGIAADACTETTTMNCVATVYDGTCTGTVLTTENFSIPTGSSLSMYPINFSNPANISSGQTYTLELSVVAGQDCALDPFSGMMETVFGRWILENASNCGGEYAGGTAYESGCSSYPGDFYIQTIVSTNAAGIDSRIECNSYTWIDGNIYTASNNIATYNIVGGAANGCDSLVTLDLTINSVSDLTTSISGTTISANNTGATYQWLDCNNNYAVINGETGQSFTASVNGNYAVKLTENDCVDTTDCIAITSVGIIENSFGNDLLIYPNPTSGNFSIDLASIFENSEISITDISGKLVVSKTITQSQVLNLSINEPAGIYIVSIQAGDKKAVIRLIKE